jgi:hypothetical protein
MNELLRKRIERKLESLPDERAYQILDFIEFLESRYGQGAPSAPPLERLAERVQDTLRAGRVPAAAIRSTMDAMGTAGRMLDGLAEAAKAAVNEVTRPAASRSASSGEQSAGSSEPSSDPSTPAKPQDERSESSAGEPSAAPEVTKPRAKDTLGHDEDAS